MAERLQKRIAELYFYKIWNQRDFRLTHYLFSDDCLTKHICPHDNEEKKCDPDKINEHIKDWLQGFPNLKVKINKLVSDSNNITSYCTLTGVHQGMWHGIKPTGKFVTIEMIVIHKISNGKISENLVMTDYLGIYQQLGVYNEQRILQQ